MSIQRDYSEKRDFIRMQVNIPASLTTESKQIDSQCVDLSATGVRLLSPDAIEVGTEVGLHIDSPHPKFSSLSADAEVLRCTVSNNLYEIALRIIQMK